MKKPLVIALILAGLGALLFYLMYQPDLDRELLKEKYANEHSSFIDIDGLQLHYRTEGSGPDLLLLHGTASSLHTWDDWVDALRSDFRLIRPDLPGFGLTGPHPDRHYSASFYADFISSFLDTLNIDSVYVAGNSLGGNIAWNLALKDNQRVKKLILIDASGYPDEDTPAIIRLAKTPVVSTLLKYITPRSIIKSNLEEVYYSDQLVSDDLVDRYFELSLYPGNRQAFIDKSRLSKEDRSPLIPDIAIPVLIQWGKHDEWIPLTDSYKFLENLPDAQLKLYEAGHVPMEELPVETAVDALRFLLDE